MLTVHAFAILGNEDWLKLGFARESGRGYQNDCTIVLAPLLSRTNIVSDTPSPSSPPLELVYTLLLCPISKLEDKQLSRRTFLLISGLSANFQPLEKRKYRNECSKLDFLSPESQANGLYRLNSMARLQELAVLSPQSLVHGWKGLEYGQCSGISCCSITEGQNGT